MARLLSGYNEKIAKYTQAMDELQNQAMKKPKDNLVYAIVAFVLSPFGIPALIYATRVDEHWYEGRPQEAEDASKSAKTWSIVSYLFYGITIVFAICMYILSFILQIFAVIMEEM